MNLHPQNLVIFLATLAIVPALYPSQASSSSALSSASSSSVGTNATNSGAASSISSDASKQRNTPSKNANQELRELGDACRKTNPRKVCYYYQLAAKLSNADALNTLGAIFYEGVDVAQNLERAHNYFLQAAQQNHPKALFNLGAMYQMGEGVTKDVKRAIDYLERAAKLGSVEASNFLGTTSYEGVDVTQNLERAHDYFLQAAQQGHADSQNELGLMHFRGLGTRRNLPKAFKWLLAAASNNQSNAQAFMYAFLQDGIGIQRDTKRAAEFFEKIQKKLGSTEAARNFIVKQTHSDKLPEPRFPMTITGEECSICSNAFELHDEIIILPCDHCFCKECITPWITDHRTCPCCRRNGITCDQFKIGITSAKE